ncbi:MAG: DUF2203 domain-containing protein [Acidobacteria bacterium]|nr:DUF2203 domain-containing protein [Acidobacteriota bacterium]
MPRYFTLHRAQNLLPEIERLMRGAVEAKTALDEAQSEIASLTGRVRLMGGMRVDPARVAEAGQTRADAAGALQSSVESIVELGVHVKDLEAGLVDFPTLYRGAEVLLCWRLGEAGISHWHGIEEGFRGRKRIDRDFLDHHAGDPEH